MTDKPAHVEYDDHQFAQLPIQTRIDAVFGDGMFYTVNKAAKWAQCTPGEIEQWICAHPELICLHPEGNSAPSFRLPGWALAAHWGQYGWSGEKELVPGIYPPRVINGKTECDILADAPLRTLAKASFAGSVTFAATLLDRLDGDGFLVEEDIGRWGLYAASGATLTRVLEGVEGITIRRNVRRREIIDLDQEWLQIAIPFYLRFIRKHLDQRATSTLTRFCPKRDEQDSYLLRWLIRGLEKLDETKGTPLGGYLASVIPNWVNDIGQDKMGRQAIGFYRTWAKWEKQGPVDEEAIAQALHLNIQDVKELRSHEHLFYKIQRPNLLVWNGGERDDRLFQAVQPPQAILLNTDVTLALIDTAVEYHDPFIVTELVAAITEGREAYIGQPVRNRLAEKLAAIQAEAVDE